MTSEGEELVYSEQGFGQSLGLKGRMALCLVDFVDGFADPAVFGGGNIADAITASIPVLDYFRNRALPISHTRIVFADDGTDANLFSAKVPGLLRLTEASAASHTVAPLAPLPGELVLRKRLPSAFAGTDYAAWLSLRAVETLVIVGCTTSGCVRATALDAMSAGFRPIVLKDCVGDRALGPHRSNLFDIAQKYGDVVSSADFFVMAAAREHDAD